MVKKVLLNLSPVPVHIVFRMESKIAQRTKKSQIILFMALLKKNSCYIFFLHCTVRIT